MSVVTKIIDNISVHIPEKTTTAVVGLSGGGKTTPCHLIARFRDVDEGRITLGGEKQRISIARAIMKDAAIIILDEATANIETKNEDMNQKAIEELTGNKTIIMIAHRLKTVRNVDNILVIDKGQIVQQGKHSELIAQKGIYSDYVPGRQEAIGWKLKA